MNWAGKHFSGTLRLGNIENIGINFDLGQARCRSSHVPLSFDMLWLAWDIMKVADADALVPDRHQAIHLAEGGGGGVGLLINASGTRYWYQSHHIYIYIVRISQINHVRVRSGGQQNIFSAPGGFLYSQRLSTMSEAQHGVPVSPAASISLQSRRWLARVWLDDIYYRKLFHGLLAQQGGC